MSSKVYKNSKNMFNLIALKLDKEDNPKSIYIRHNNLGYISFMVSNNDKNPILIGAFYKYIPDYLNCICKIANESGLVKKTSSLKVFNDYMQVELFLKEDNING